MKKLRVIMLFIILVATGAYGAGLGIWDARNLGYIVISPHGPMDGGDFGPKTGGSTTAGFQEAIDYAWANARDIYVVDGGLRLDRTDGTAYHVGKTIHFPPGLNRRFEGGESWLVLWEPSGDAMVFDSQVNCYFRFGVTVGAYGGSDQVVVRIKPTTPGPDGQVSFYGNKFEFNATVGSKGAMPADIADCNGVGMVLDGSQAVGGIHNNKFNFCEVIMLSRGLYLQQDVYDNTFECPWIHWVRDSVQVGNAATASTVSGNIFKLMVGPGNTGVQIFGRKNLFTLSDVFSYLSNANVIFEAPAYDNLIFNVQMPQGYTSYATQPTNRIISSGALVLGYQVATPAVPASNTDSVNSEPFPVEVQIVGAGQVTQWRLTDAEGNSQTFNGGFRVGQYFSLNPGGKVRLTYSQVPSWRWMGRN